MSSHDGPATRDTAPAGRAAASVPRTLLVLAGPFGAQDATGAAALVARGLRAGGWAEADLLPVQSGAAREGVLADASFGARLPAARALVIAWEALLADELAGSVPFEAATAARQGGVPAFALTAEEDIGAFGARMLDLQVVLRTGPRLGLAAAARRLAALI